jgi:hypothetical protein
MIRSTLLRDSVVSELDDAGNKFNTTVGVDGMLFAIQNSPAANSGTQPSVTWLHRDPAGMSEVTPSTADKKAVYDPAGRTTLTRRTTSPPT